MRPSPTRRAVIYARYSTDMQNPTSVEDQFALCRRTAEAQGWTIVGEYGDRSQSSFNNRRPEYLRLMQDLKSGEFDTILTESLDRISRDGEDIAHFYKRTRHSDVAIHALDRGEIGIVDIGLAGLMGGMFLEGLSRKTHRGIEAKVMKGQSGGGRSFGYRAMRTASGEKIKGTLEIDPEEAAVVRRIFADFARGLSPIKIAAALNDEGVPAPRSGRERDIHWRQNTINGNRKRGTGILNNELYIGRQIWNRLEYRKDPDTRKRVSRLRPREEWRIVEVPDLRIVEDDLWQQVKARQDNLSKAHDREKATTPNGFDRAHGARRRKYLLSGLMECGLCGGNLIVAGAGRSRGYYCANHKQKGASVCSGMPGVRQRDIEPFVLDAFKHQLMTDAAYERFRAEVKAAMEARRASAREALSVLDTQIAEARRRHANLMENIESGRVPQSVFDRLEATEAEIARLEAERAAAEPGPVALPEELPEIWRARIAQLEKTLSDSEVVERASDELRGVVDRLVVRPDDASGGHLVSVYGKLTEMLRVCATKDAASVEAAASSLSLVAGTGFEPVTFRL